MAHLHSVYDSDTHFSINPITRAITNESSSKTTLIQFDHNSERFTFELPRMIEGHDMSKCNLVQVHYINIDNATKSQNNDVYNADDFQISPDGDDTVICSWLISQNATQLVGSLNFLLRFACIADDGTVEYAWHTATHTKITISSGMNNGEEVTKEYPDILAQWEARIRVVEHDVNAKITELSQSFANAITGVAQGAVVRLDDVSPVEHKVRVKVSGKNLIKPFTETHIYTREGMAQSCEKGGQCITLNGIGNSTGGGRNNFRDVCGLFTVEKGKTYTLSHKLVSGTCDGVYTVYISAKDGYDAVESCANTYPSKTFVSDYSGECYVGINVVSGVTYDNAVVCFQLEEGDTATEYEPYIDPTTVKVERCGKNIFKNTLKTKTLNGITLTVNEDGCITCNGTVEKTTFFNLGKISPTIGATHRLSGSPSGSGFDSYILYIHNNTSGTDVSDVGQGKVFVGADGDQSMILAMYEGTTVSNLTFYPMVVCGEDSGEYEPYNGTTYIPSEDGIVDVVSVSPTMTIITDTDGVNLEVKYNRDTNKVIENIEVSGGDGADGGYYTPSVKDNGNGTMTVSFAASKAGMPTVNPITITLPVPADGYTPVADVDYPSIESIDKYIADELANRNQFVPIPVASVEAMTDTTKIYYLTATGELYAYAPTQVVSGYTNLADHTSEDWNESSRFNASSAISSAVYDKTVSFVSNAIPVKPDSEIYIKNVTAPTRTDAGATQFSAVLYDEGGSILNSGKQPMILKEVPGSSFTVTTVNQCWNAVTLMADGSYKWRVGASNSGANTFSTVAYIRVAGVATSSYGDVIITVDEPIVEPTIETVYKWAGTGHFISSEEAITALESRVNELEDKTEELEFTVDRLKTNSSISMQSGAVWYALGDSITEGYMSAIDSSASSGYKSWKATSERWVDYVAQLNGYQLTNKGVGGTGYVQGTNNARAQVDNIDFSGCDLVTLAYGVNDWKYTGNTIGTLDDDIATGGTMVSNLRYIIKKILTDNPYCKIFVITPINCRTLGSYDTNWGIDYAGDHSSGGSLENIFTAIKSVCEYHGIEMIDMTHSSVVNRENIRTALADYVHPTAECHRVMGYELARKIKFA